MIIQGGVPEKEPKAASHLFFSHAARASLIIRDNG
jgi:hypothetical protein